MAHSFYAELFKSATESDASTQECPLLCTLIEPGYLFADITVKFNSDMTSTDMDSTLVFVCWLIDAGAMRYFKPRASYYLKIDLLEIM